MTVNELITKLDLLPADAEVILAVKGSEAHLANVELVDTGEVVLED